MPDRMEADPWEASALEKWMPLPSEHIRAPQVAAATVGKDERGCVGDCPPAPPVHAERPKGGLRNLHSPAAACALRLPHNEAPPNFGERALT